MASLCPVITVAVHGVVGVKWTRYVKLIRCHTFCVNVAGAVCDKWLVSWSPLLSCLKCCCLSFNCTSCAQIRVPHPDCCAFQSVFLRSPVLGLGTGTAPGREWACAGPRDSSGRSWRTAKGLGSQAWGPWPSPGPSAGQPLRLQQGAPQNLSRHSRTASRGAGR